MTLRNLEASGRGAAPASAQAGVALAIVVWFIAGMSLLVAGIVAQARVDTHMAQNHLARAIAVAAGDGAIHLMMADMMAANDPLLRARGEVPDGKYRVGEIDATVILVPTSGLIDLGSASADVMSALFQVAGGQAEEDARLLAQNMVQSRSAVLLPGGAEQGVKLDAMEDLLRVPGFSRTLLDSVRDFIVVGEIGAGGTNWSRAPEALLPVLGMADAARAEMVRARGAIASGSEGRAQPIASAYRADAIVQYGDKVWLRRRWISIVTSSVSVLPWRVVRTEPPRVLTKEDFLLNGSVDA